MKQHARSAVRNPRCGAARHAAQIALAVVAFVAISGCATLRAQLSTRAALNRDGFSGVSVSFQAATDPSAPDVLVSYTGGPTGQQQTDDRTAAGIVWNTLPYRFGRLGLVHRHGGCVGSICTGSSSTAVISYEQMQAAFGTRPARLDAKSVRAELQHEGVVVLAAIALVALVVVAGAIITIVLVVRARDRRRLPPPSYPPGSPQWYPQGPPPPWSQPAAAWSPAGQANQQEGYFPESAATTGASTSAWPPGSTT